MTNTRKYLVRKKARKRKKTRNRKMKGGMDKQLQQHHTQIKQGKKKSQELLRRARTHAQHIGIHARKTIKHMGNALPFNSKPMQKLSRKNARIHGRRMGTHAKLAIDHVKHAANAWVNRAER
jgi:hypothetical protein